MQFFKVREVGAVPFNLTAEMPMEEAMKILALQGCIFRLEGVTWQDGHATVKFIPDNGMIPVYEAEDAIPPLDSPG